MILGLCGETKLWALPLTKCLGLMIIYIYRPIPRHVNDIIDCPVPAARNRSMKRETVINKKSRKGVT